VVHVREGETRAGVAAGVYTTQIVLSVKEVLPLLCKGKTVAADTASLRMKHSGYKALAFELPFRFSGFILTPEQTSQGIEPPWCEYCQLGWQPIHMAVVIA
jgi:hypothetical protein